MIKSKLSVKVFLLTALLTAVSCFLIYSFLSWSVPNFYKHDMKDGEMWIEYLPEIMAEIGNEEASFFLEEMEKEMQSLFENEFELHLFRSDGREVDIGDFKQLLDGEISDFDISKSNEYTLLFADSDSPYTLLLTRNIKKRTQMEEALYKAFPSLSMVVLGISLVSAFFFSWYMTAPIKKVSRISKKMADMDFGTPCMVHRTDEIGVLSDSLNELSRKLSAALSELQEDIDRERQLERQRVEFFSAASHELKTPITIIKGQLQGMLYNVGRYKDRETYLAKSIEVADTLEKMVQELLVISRIDAPGYTCNKSHLNLSQLLNDRFSEYEDLFMQKALSVERFIAPEIYIAGDAQLLQMVLNNLLGNAATYSPPENHILVKLWKDAEKVRLTIENTGIHIPEEDIPRLYEAFYRVDQSRNRQTGGSGLGLYIVKTVLDLHEAEIEIANTAQGVMVSVEF